MKTLIDILKGNERISDWRVNEKKRISNELFFVHERLETVRSTETTETSVTVYLRHDGAVGDSTFKIAPAMTEREIEERIETALKRAALVFNEPFELPEGGECDEILSSNLSEISPKTLGSRIAKAVFSAGEIENGGINALEIFIYRDEISVKNSRGVDKKQQKRSVMIEAIPTYNGENDSVEVYEAYTFTDYDEAALIARIKEKMADVRARAFARKPKTPMTVNVILRPYEIASLFFELAENCRYSSVYSHANVFSVGDDIQSAGSGDKIDLSMKAAVKGSAYSSLFDVDGTTLSDVKIIDNGVIARYFGLNRYGQYLKIDKISGESECIKLKGGSLNLDEEKEPYLDCVSLSNLQLEPYNDYIGGEIRLAYYCDKEKTVPVTGITMSAKLSEVLKELKLSKNMIVEGGYFGPDRLMLKKVTVL